MYLSPPSVPPRVRLHVRRDRLLLLISSPPRIPGGLTARSEEELPQKCAASEVRVCYEAWCAIWCYVV